MKNFTTALPLDKKVPLNFWSHPNPDSWSGPDQFWNGSALCSLLFEV